MCLMLMLKLGGKKEFVSCVEGLGNSDSQSCGRGKGGKGLN